MEAVNSVKEFLMTLYVVLKMFILSLLGFEVLSHGQQRRSNSASRMRGGNCGVINAGGGGG